MPPPFIWRGNMISIRINIHTISPSFAPISQPWDGGATLSNGSTIKYGYVELFYGSATLLTLIIFVSHLKSPREEGASRWCITDQLPALSPPMVTRALSPPSCLMFSWTQCSARLWSRNPCPKQVLMNFLCSNSFVCDASYFYPECVTLPLDLFIFHWPGYQTPAPCPGWADQGAPVCSWPWQWWGHNQSGTGARACHLWRDDTLLS